MHVGSTYITKRKLQAALQSLCFYMCWVFPIKGNLISVCTFEGKGGFGCNPKYLVQELHKRNPDYKFVWLVDNINSKFPSYIKPKHNTTWSRAYWLSRSKIWIDNYRKPYGTIKRRNQYYINTNHYTLGIKCTGLLRGEGFSRMAYLVSKSDSDMIDGLVIDSKWCEQCFDKAMVYDGVMLKTGAPRCDALYGDRSERRKAFRQRHGLKADARIVMFAPTFREGAKDGKRYVFSEVWTIDFERLIAALEMRFGGEWYICVRVHPQLASTFATYHNEKVEKRLIDESQADDMYEILAAMDAYITDYSSAVFEAGFARIPAFIYADDVDEYSKARGNLFWELNGADRRHIVNNKEVLPDMDLILPFCLARNSAELEEDILAFDEHIYKEGMDTFQEKIELVFDGKASERLADIIEKQLS